MPAGLPMPCFPEISFAKITAVLPSAFTIAFLAGIEALLSAVVADGMDGTRHRSNQELIGQGAANLGSALFGGLPAAGAIARTATNRRYDEHPYALQQLMRNTDDYFCLK